MIVDVHQHYSDGAHYPEYADYPARLVDALDRYGWQWACVSGCGPRFWNLGNEAVAEAVERYPDRIAGLGFLDPDRAEPGHVDDLKRMGMRGLKVIGTLKRYDDDAYLPFYERAEANQLPVLFHTGYLGGPVLDTPVDESSDRYSPMTLDRVSRMFPALTLIAAHMGTQIWFKEATAVMMRPNVYGDVSGGVASWPAEFFRRSEHSWMQWEKALFASDSLPNDSHIPFNALAKLMDELELSEGVRRGILGETAAKLFGLHE